MFTYLNQKFLPLKRDQHSSTCMGVVSLLDHPVRHHQIRNGCSLIPLFTARKRSLGQGNVFTPVCLFTGGGGLPTGGSESEGVCLQGGAGLHLGEGVCPTLPGTRKAGYAFFWNAFLLSIPGTWMKRRRISPLVTCSPTLSIHWPLDSNILIWFQCMYVPSMYYVVCCIFQASHRFEYCWLSQDWQQHNVWTRESWVQLNWPLWIPIASYCCCF